MEDENGLITNQDVESAIAEPEHMVPQSKVNELIGLAKAKAYEKARAELQAQPMQNQNLNMPIDAQAQSPQGVGGMPPEIDSRVQQIIDERIEAEQARQEEMRAEQERGKYEDYVKGVALTYLDKMSKGKEMHEDFEAIMSDFDASENKELVFLASELEDPASVLYELNKNQPMNLLAITQAAKYTPKLAKRMLDSLQESIKSNKQAVSEHVSAKPPLSQIKPSSAAGADGGQRTIQDYKKIYRG